MAEPVIDIIPKTTHVSAVNNLAHSFATVTVQDEARLREPILQRDEKDTAASCPIRIYTRQQLLLLHNSPLVTVPPNMPVLKDWFGTDNEQSLSKKDLETIVPNPARDRRSRRDAEESPMGNFKHQRPNDDRGLRHLPEKFVSPTQRDTAPHLNSSSNRSSAQSQAPATASRRADAREAAKKKGGEASDDWRRGAEPRSGREERLEQSRRDRDERDRPRSRVRDSSKQRRDPSLSRRDRDRDREDKDRVRSEREREGDSRKDRDADREIELDDPRRWRDDGKRDERMAARRGDRYPEQYRDQERGRDKDSTWDSTAERRWVPVEERDGRSKRLTGRERRNGPNADDKERDDRRRDRDRERDKEPAWMDTYIPNPSSGNILGGKGVDGELDGIQAWKKGMKERESKATINESNGLESRQPVPDDQLDEIQLFRLLMKREEKKKSDNADAHASLLGTPSPAVHGVANLSNLQNSQMLKTSEDTSQNMDDISTVQGVAERSSHLDTQTAPLPQPEISLPSARGTPLDHKETSNATPSPSSASLEFATGGLKASSSSQVPLSHTLQESNASDMERASLPPLFNPPQGSRLLAFARTPSAASRPQPAATKFPNGDFQATGTVMLEPALPQGPSTSDAAKSLSGFSPFEDTSRTSFISEGPGKFADSTSAHHQELRERMPFTPPTEHGSFQDASSDNGVGFSAAKGSRFAKFFDGKGRDGGLTVAKPHGPIGFISSSPGPNSGQRQDHFNGVSGGPTDHRTMDDIYAMLNSSTQNQRGAAGNIPGSAPLSHVPFGQQAQHNLHLFQQQQVFHQNQQQMHNNRLESLYESRLDDRNFMPDGMVPGLRSAPPRTRENAGYADVLDDPHLNHHPQRLHQQHRVDQMYSGSMYSQQTGRNNGFPLQPPHYRGGTSPIPGQPLSLPQQQRIPPGLANLGGRPPLEPSQFLGMPGVPAPGLHGGLHLNGSSQPPYNTFTAGSNLNYAGGQQGRVLHQPPTPVVHQVMGGPGHQSHMDLRAANSTQVLGISGVGLGGIRGVSGGYPSHQGPPQGQGALLAMRPQHQQQQLPPHMAPHLLPPHLQQQGPPGLNNQPTHDLMALLMGGTHRE